MKAWEPAYEDWLSGKKYQEIADKYEVSVNTVKSWVSRYFKPKQEKEVATSPKRLQPSKPKKLQPSNQGGAPSGNQNAKGHGAPKGNQNHFIHGAYANPCFDTIPENVMERLNAMGFENEETVLVDKLKLLTYRESQLMKSIQTFENKQSGITLDSVTKRVVETVEDEPRKGITRQTETVTKTKDVFDVLRNLHTELTRVQRLKLNTIIDLRKIRMDKLSQCTKPEKQEQIDFSKFSENELRRLIDIGEGMDTDSAGIQDDTEVGTDGIIPEENV